MKNTIAVIGVLFLVLIPAQITLAEEDCDGVDELRIYSGHIARWLGIDPLADKYPDVSPYVYCEDNPLMYVDPDGMSNYGYDNKSGKFILLQLTEDDFDRIVKCKYNEETQQYEIKGEGNPKYYGGKDVHVAKGILRNGLNFKNHVACVEIGEDDNDLGKPTCNDIYEFALIVDTYITYCEILGVIVELGGKKAAIFLPYKNNDMDNGKFDKNDVTPKNNVVVFFHTHGQCDSESEAMAPSPEDKKAADYPSIKRLIIYNNEHNETCIQEY